MLNFAIIGAAGYIAPRHMASIKAVGGNLVAALDPHDSIGIIDKYFPECHYFREFERFDRYLEKLNRENNPVHYVTICSPNYLHDSHCMFAMRIGAQAICEKPVVLTERNLDALLDTQNEFVGDAIWPMYQLRCHPQTQMMLDMVNDDVGAFFKLDVEYNTPRGRWYMSSWKGDVEKSGGLYTNIGCHLFDVASYVFGKARTIRSDGILFDRAYCNFSLSTNQGEVKRVFTVNGSQFDLSDMKAELHTEMYRRIINGDGVKLEDVRESVRICEALRCQ